MKYIPNWQNKDLQCHFCGERRSVKYYARIAMGNGFVPSGMTDVPCCNKCALLKDHPTEKGGVQD